MSDEKRVHRDSGRKRARRHGALTPELRALLLEHLEVGVFRTNAAALIGVHHTTLEAWMQKGRAELQDACEEMDRTGKMPTLGRYADLVVAVEAAEARIERDMVGVVTTIARAGEKHPEAAPKAATWYLERRKNLVYGRGALRIGVDLDPATSPTDDEDPVDLFLEKLESIERNVQAARDRDKPEGT